MASKRSRRTAIQLTREQCVLLGRMIAMGAVSIAFLQLGKVNEGTPGLYRRHLLRRRPRLGGGDPSKHPGAKEGDTHVYFHPKSQRAFYLRFTDEGLTAYHCTRAPDDVRLRARGHRPRKQSGPSQGTNEVGVEWL